MQHIVVYYGTQHKYAQFPNKILRYSAGISLTMAPFTLTPPAWRNFGTKFNANGRRGLYRIKYMTCMSHNRINVSYRKNAVGELWISLVLGLVCSVNKIQHSTIATNSPKNRPFTRPYTRAKSWTPLSQRPWVANRFSHVLPLHLFNPYVWWSSFHLFRDHVHAFTLWICARWWNNVKRSAMMAREFGIFTPAHANPQNTHIAECHKICVCVAVPKVDPKRNRHKVNNSEKDTSLFSSGFFMPYRVSATTAGRFGVLLRGLQRNISIVTRAVPFSQMGENYFPILRYILDRISRRMHNNIAVWLTYYIIEKGVHISPNSRLSQIRARSRFTHKIMRLTCDCDLWKRFKCV